jgi:hypothetical protein
MINWRSFLKPSTHIEFPGGSWNNVQKDVWRSFRKARSLPWMCGGAIVGSMSLTRREEYLYVSLRFGEAAAAARKCQDWQTLVTVTNSSWSKRSWVRILAVQFVMEAGSNFEWGWFRFVIEAGPICDRSWLQLWLKLVRFVIEVWFDSWSKMVPIVIEAGLICDCSNDPNSDPL